MKKDKRAWSKATWVLVACWLTAAGPADKSRFEAERTVLLQRIQDIQRILRQTASQKKAGMGQLNALNGQIESNTLLIRTLSQELQGIEQGIQQKQQAIAVLTQDLAQLKQEYAAMVYVGAKSLHAVHQLMFIFAAPSFHQLVQRLRHVKQYARTQHQHFLEIEKVKATLQNEQSAAGQRRQAKATLLKARQVKKGKLNGLKTKQTRLIRELQQQRTKLTQELQQRNKAVQRLDRLIKKLIQQELKAKATRQAAKKKPIAVVPKAVKKLTTLFRRSRGKLPWPVKTGFISGKFGIGPHPVLRKVQVENLGIDIQTQAGAQAYAIFEGTVKRTVFVPGMNWVVIIQHGDYHTVYAKLKRVTVKAGQYVQTATPLGTVATDTQGTTELQLQVWKATQKLNPAWWLRKQ